MIPGLGLRDLPDREECKEDCRKRGMMQWGTWGELGSTKWLCFVTFVIEFLIALGLWSQTAGVQILALSLAAVELQVRTLVSFSLPENRGFMTLWALGKIKWCKSHKAFNRGLTHSKDSINATSCHLVMETNCIVDMGWPEKNLRRLSEAKLWGTLFVLQNDLNLILQSLGNLCRFWSNGLVIESCGHLICAIHGGSLLEASQLISYIYILVLFLL